MNSKTILVLGNSGQGKTTSLMNIPEDKHLYINIADKDLPFVGSRKKYRELTPTSDGNMILPTRKDKTVSADIAKKVNYALNKYPDFEYYTFDDIQYLMTYEFMDRIHEKGFAKWNEIGSNFNQIINLATSIGKTKNVVVFAHTNEKEKLKTVGKLTDDVVTPEGLFTVVLVTDPKKSLGGGSVEEYRFRTQTNGSDPVKSPMGMFPEFIPNDMKLVFDRMDEYYEEGLTIEESKVLTKQK